MGLAAFLFAGVGAFLYWAIRALLDERQASSALVERSRNTPSMAPLPNLAVRNAGQLLYMASELIESLVEGGVFGVNVIETVITWRNDFDRRDADQLDITELLKRAYDIVNGIRAAHEQTPAMDPEQTRSVYVWLDYYSGKRAQQ